MATAHFSDAELACRDGCGLLPPQDFQDKLERLRIEYGEPLKVSSGARCPAHNARESGTGRTGPHTVAACDFKVSGAAAYRLLAAALRLGFGGIGVNQKGPMAQRFIHVDDRRAHPGPTVWSY